MDNKNRGGNKVVHNKLSDLNNYLFEMIERVNDDNQSKEELEKEIARAQAISGIADKIIKNASIQLDACKLAYEAGVDITVPKLLLGD